MDWAEFRAFVLSKERKVQHAFRRIDKDGSGSISVDELVRHAARRPLSALLC